MVDDVSTTSRETARDTADVADRTTAQAESLGETVTDVKALADAADELSEQVAAFEAEPRGRTDERSPPAAAESPDSDPARSGRPPARSDGGRE